MPDNNHHEDMTIEEIIEKGGKLVESSSIGGAFETPSSTDNIKHLMTPGDSPLDLAMRADIVSTRTAFCITTDMQKCVAHKCEEGTKFNLMLLASLAGVRGKRANLIRDCLVGERKMMAEGGGFGGKIRKFMGLDGE